MILESKLLYAGLFPFWYIFWYFYRINQIFIYGSNNISPKVHDQINKVCKENARYFFYMILFRDF